ncbi:MAG: hypothetical protein AAF497_07530 [Planctomycetota bacterium]
MGKIITYVVLCVALFAAGLGIAIALGVPQQAEVPAELNMDLIPEDIASLVPADPTASLLDMDADDPQPVTDTELPVAVRGKPLSAEELFRFGAMYREQQEALNLREKELERRQSQLKLIHDDLSGSRKEYDGLRAEVRDAIQKASLVIQQLQQQADEIKAQQPDTPEGNQPGAAAQPVVDNSENIRKIAAWLESMPVESAAEYIKELSNSGQIDSAVEFLGNIEERNASKILATMEDPTLVVQLTEAFLQVKRQKPNDNARQRR